MFSILELATDYLITAGDSSSMGLGSDFEYPFSSPNSVLVFSMRSMNFSCLKFKPRGGNTGRSKGHVGLKVIFVNYLS